MQQRITDPQIPPATPCGGRSSTVQFVTATTGNSITCPSSFVQIHFTRQKSSTGDKIPLLEVSAKTSITIIVIRFIEGGTQAICSVDYPSCEFSSCTKSEYRRNYLQHFHLVCSREQNRNFQGKYGKIEMKF